MFFVRVSPYDFVTSLTQRESLEILIEVSRKSGIMAIRRLIIKREKKKKKKIYPQKCMDDRVFMSDVARREYDECCCNK